MSVTLVTFEGARYEIEDVRRMLDKTVWVDLRPDPIILFDCYGRAFRLEPWEEITLPKITSREATFGEVFRPLASQFGLKITPWWYIVAPESITAKLTKL